MFSNAPNNYLSEYIALMPFLLSQGHMLLLGQLAKFEPKLHQCAVVCGAGGPGFKSRCRLLSGLLLVQLCSAAVGSGAG